MTTPDPRTARETATEAPIRLEAWLAGRQANVHSEISTTLVRAETYDRTSSSYTLAESDLHAVLAERNALVGKVAELEAKWDAAARTVAVYMYNRAQGGAASAELHALFADRIAALEDRA